MWGHETNGTSIKTKEWKGKLPLWLQAAQVKVCRAANIDL